MIIGEYPDAANLVQMPLDAQCPAIERRFPLPEQLAITMDPLAVAIVLVQCVTEQTKVKKVGRNRLELEGRLVAFVQGAGVGPNPADAVFFEQVNNGALVPARMTELNREPKIRRQLGKKFAQALFFFLRRIGRGQLDENDWQFRRERLERVEKGGQLRPAITQSPFVSNFARQFAGETKVRRRHFLPSSRDSVRGRAVKGRINFDREEVARVILQPAVGRPIWRIKCTAPFLEAPGAGSDANFLLLDQLQSGRGILTGISQAQSIR